MRVTQGLGVLIGGSFWQKDRLITPILFELCMSITIFSPVSNFGDQSLQPSQVQNFRQF